MWGFGPRLEIAPSAREGFARVRLPSPPDGALGDQHHEVAWEQIPDHVNEWNKVASRRRSVGLDIELSGNGVTCRFVIQLLRLVRRLREVGGVRVKWVDILPGIPETLPAQGGERDG
jgi:hypothetical protein